LQYQPINPLIKAATHVTFNMFVEINNKNTRLLYYTISVEQTELYSR